MSDMREKVRMEIATAYDRLAPVSELTDRVIQLMEQARAEEREQTLREVCDHAEVAIGTAVSDALRNEFGGKP